MIERRKEPPKLDEEEDDEFGNFGMERPTTPAGEPAPDERPTVSPPFDVEEYAKESDSKMVTERSMNPDAPTRAPPIPEFDQSDHWKIEEEPSTQDRLELLRSPQITLTDEGETEEARLRSVLMNSVPPKPGSGSDAPPATRGYPAEYEKDPFAHIDKQAASPPRAGAARTVGAKNAARELERDELGDMRDRFSLGDYTGALAIAETILGRGASGEADRCAEECRAKLIHMYTARVGPLDRVPVVMVAREQLRWLSIDHRAGFLLSHIDGVSSLEMILDVSGMPLLDALKILAELAQQRVISFR